MDRVFDIAIVGATGLVGESILSILEERNFPVGKLFLVASERSAGSSILFQKQSISVENIEDFDFSQAQVALFSAGGDVSAHYAPIAADSGCVVIDNTSYFRNDPDVPLVIPEVNPDQIANYTTQNIISNPNCSTIQMLVALAPIHQAVGIEAITVSTYQAVAGAGKKGVEALAKQTAQLLNAKALDVAEGEKQIAFNVVPKIDDFMDNGFTREEMKMVWETQKILDEAIQVNPTCVRVPVFHGHSEAVFVETQSYISAEEVREMLENAEGVTVLDNPDSLEYATPVTDAVGNDAVYVSRIRETVNGRPGIHLWITADNVRKGAALNAVQIAEKLINDYI